MLNNISGNIGDEFNFVIREQTFRKCTQLLKANFWELIPTMLDIAGKILSIR